LRVGFSPPAPLSLSFDGLAGQSDWERGGWPPYTASRSRVSGLLPCRWSGAPDLCAQIRGAAGFLLIGLELLWPEQTLARWDVVPLNKVWAAGCLLVQRLVAAMLFLAGLGGEGKGDAGRCSQFFFSWPAVEARRS
jgi:hypothetical protein